MSTMYIEINSEIIQIKQDTKAKLESLKKVGSESYDEVIKRVLKSIDDEKYLELNDESKKIIEKRLKLLKEGKVMSEKELLNRIQK